MKINVVYLLFLFILFFSCSHEPPIQPDYGDSSSGSSSDSNAEGFSLIKDKKMGNGILLRGNNTSSQQTGRYIYPFGGEGKTPSWKLAEWASKYLINQSDFIEKGDTITYEDQGKLVSFRHEGKGTDIRLEVKGENEYDHPRRDGEDWVHLLLEQDFVVKPLLEDIDKLKFTFSGRLIKCIMEMPEGDFNPSIHTAQFQLFLTIQDLNKESSGNGDFLWFGIPFYDYRYEFNDPYAAQDLGKEDASKKFIYSIGSKDITQVSFHSKKWIHVNVDLKPFMDDAVQIAKERGFLPHSSKKDLKISGMNIGWEVPGTFDAEFEFKDFDIIYIK